MCCSRKPRKYSCFAGNNSLFYVLFSLTVIALTWKLSWHFAGNKKRKKTQKSRISSRSSPVCSLAPTLGGRGRHPRGLSISASHRNQGNLSESSGLSATEAMKWSLWETPKLGPLRVVQHIGLLGTSCRISCPALRKLHMVLVTSFLPKEGM